VEPIARDRICQIFHLSFSAFPLTVVVAAAVVMLMAVVPVVVAVAVSNNKYI